MVVNLEEIESLRQRLEREQGASGYHMNPDLDFVRELVKGLLVNQYRYGYQACPCRLASGDRRDDADLICPCDYRDADVSEHGACYCGLYVSLEVLRGEKPVKSIPERRPPPEERARIREAATRAAAGGGPLAYPVWRCRVCGYLCAREEPPDTCPICKVRKERFERFM